MPAGLSLMLYLREIRYFDCLCCIYDLVIMTFDVDMTLFVCWVKLKRFRPWSAVPIK